MKLIEDLDRREIGNSGNKVRFALFECEFCKNQIIKQKQNGLRDFSCGCTRYKLSSKGITKHGDSNKNSKYKNLFGIWAGMRDRCNRKTNQDYKYYGAKGIIVENIWNDYLEFKKWSILNGYEPNKNLQIDRIDSNKNYSPENCRWVSPTINQRNRDCVLLNMTKVNEIRILLTKNIPISKIAEMYKVHPDTIKDIKKGKTWQH